MRYALISLIFVVLVAVGPAAAQDDPLGLCFLEGKSYTPGSDEAIRAFTAFIEEQEVTGAAIMAATLRKDHIVEKSIHIEYSKEMESAVIIVDARNVTGGTYHYTIVVDPGSIISRTGPANASWNGSIEKAALDTLPPMTPSPGVKPWHMVGLGGGVFVVVAVEPGGPISYPDPIYERAFYNCIHVGLDSEPMSGKIVVKVPPDNFCLGGCNNLLPIQFTF